MSNVVPVRKPVQLTPADRELLVESARRLLRSVDAPTTNLTEQEAAAYLEQAQTLLNECLRQIFDVTNLLACRAAPRAAE